VSIMGCAPADTWNYIPCSTYRNEVRSVHLETVVADPRQVALLDRDGRTLIASGGGAIDVPFGGAGQPTGPFSSGAYSIRARRESDGGLVLLWTSDMPLPQGGRQVLVASDGSLGYLYVKADALGLPAILRRGSLDLRLCITVERARYGGIIPRSDADTSEKPCAWTVHLSTPSSNVALVREVTGPTPDYSGTWDLARSDCNLPPREPESARVIFGAAAPP
jgi:hypothetical protein